MQDAFTLTDHGPVYIPELDTEEYIVKIKNKNLTLELYASNKNNLNDNLHNLIKYLNENWKN